MASGEQTGWDAAVDPRDRNRGALRTTAALAGILLPAFWLLDWAVVPQHVRLLLVIRLLGACVCGAIWLATLHAPRWVRAHADMLTSGVVVLLGGSVAVMCWLHQGLASPYYAGIFLVVLGAGVLFSWPLSQSTATFASIYAIYMLPAAFLGTGGGEKYAILSNQFFLLSTMLIVIVTQRHRFGIEQAAHRAHQREQSLKREFERLATVDELSNLANRRSFEATLEREIHRARRYERPLSVILLDIDHFKKVNDRHGHLVGDEVIRGVADRIVAQVRSCDVAGRYGGEEFVVILPETPCHDALHVVAERLGEALRSQPMQTAAGPLRITASFGVASLGNDCAAVPTLLARADEALYEAKHAGRDCARANGASLPRAASTAGEPNGAAKA